MAENEEIIERVRTLPDRVAAEIEGLSEEALRRRPAEGEWSMKEVCGHLRDDSEVWRRRLYMMITQTDPVLPAYDQEALVREGAVPGRRHCHGARRFQAAAAGDGRDAVGAGAGGLEADGAAPGLGPA